MKKHQHMNNLTLMGVFIIIVGLLLLAMTNGWFGLDKTTSWPISLVVIGLAFLIPLAKKPHPIASALLAFFGTELLLLGLFFLKFTLGLFAWEDMGKLWPSFILIPGLALIAAHVAADRKYNLLFTIGTVISAISLIFLLLLLLAEPYINLAQSWPIFVIVAGLSFLLIPRLKK